MVDRFFSPLRWGMAVVMPSMENPTIFSKSFLIPQEIHFRSPSTQTNNGTNQYLPKFQHIFKKTVCQNPNSTTTQPFLSQSYDFAHHHPTQSESKIVWTQNIFGPKKFLGPKIFGSNIFLTDRFTLFVWTHNSFGRNFFFNQKKFGSEYFFEQSFYLTKKFWMKDFLTS